MVSRWTLGAAALAAAATLCQPTYAAAGAVERGQTVIQPTRAFDAALAQAGVRQSALRPATYRGGRLALPIAAGRCTRPGTGTITGGGALWLHRGRRSATISHITFVLGAREVVTARIGGRQMAAFVLDRRHARLVGNVMRWRLSGLRLTLTRAAAAKIDGLLADHPLRQRRVAPTAIATVTCGRGAAGASSPAMPAGSAGSVGSVGSVGQSGATGTPAPAGGAGSPTGVGLPSVPGLPGVPTLPGVPGVLGTPSVPSVPGAPGGGVSGVAGVVPPGLPTPSGTSGVTAPLPPGL